MLRAFPKPYTDETLYSVLARYSSGRYYSVPTAMQDFFGNLEIQPSLHFPSYLSELVKRLPDNYDPCEILLNHTILPYYTHFITTDRAHDLISHIMDNRGNKIHLLLGTCGTKVKLRKYLVCCPKCIEDDFETHGEPFWHRVHQLPGTLVCPFHNVILLSDCRECGVSLFDLLYKGYQITPSHCKNGHYIPHLAVKNENLVLQKIAKENQLVLDSRLIGQDMNEWRNLYVKALDKQRFQLKRIDKKEVSNDFFNFYSEEDLTQLGISLPRRERRSNWISELWNEYKRMKSFPPLMHVLFSIFLFGGIESGKNLTFDGPFGTGPWPCLNKTDDHYATLCITDVLLAQNSYGRPVGIFTCNDCGFKYQINGPDTSNFAEKKKVKIIDYGHKWEKRIRTLLQTGLGIGTIADKMHVHYSTVNKFIEQGTCKTETIQEIVIRSKQSRRNEFLECTSQLPDGITRSELRDMLGFKYDWLWVNDRDWLVSILPSRKRIRIIGSRDYGLYTPERDILLAQRVLQVVAEVREGPGLPRKITKELIGRLIKWRFKSHQLDRLPMTKTAVLSSLEANEDFNKRKVDYFIRNLTESGERPALYKIRKHFPLTLTPELNEYILMQVRGANESVRMQKSKVTPALDTIILDQVAATKEE